MSAPIYVGFNLQPPTAQLCSVKMPQIGPFGGECSNAAAFSVKLSFAVPGLGLPIADAADGSSGTTLVNLCDYHLRVAGMVYEGYSQRKPANKQKQKEKNKP